MGKAIYEVHAERTQVAVRVVEAECERDAEATVEFRPDEDEGLPTWVDFLDAACGNAEYAELLAERCGVGGAFEGSWPSSVVEQDLNEGEVEFVDGKLVLTGGRG